ncbi:Domain of unknown function DUF559 [uncultured Caudovirales phage]|uniref:DUF559 domain-containing protein n=1 Tax=uncultured Caudovirales phage TaxID=2100421 RepID=A0A6J5P6Z6_9CAUD|nr:Domain of unknown function DUF559 [uncultured Caudovirales phage]CAB4165786.1 Domain of unknown function DUF559 [uncultured Caudovirales phage]CAB4186984.1 Domain of unknown function DUF559 [uncultured Caudovirales phage]CAB4221268.1 Domain of unknown function DUF559 [uncultured Caudovirales phage]
MLYCKFCGKDSFKQLKTHERQCKSNPNRTSATGHVGKNHYSYGAICSKDTRRKISEYSKTRTVSAEVRAKISVSRKKFLNENPHMVPYLLNHSSKISYPEQYFKDCFKDINLVTEHKISRYSLDFSNVDKKIYFEVDGEQHYVDKKIVASDIVRTEYLKELGWIGYRCRWSEFQKLNEDERKEYVHCIIKSIA